MKVNKIGIAAAGTVAVAGIVANLVTRLVISKKAKADEANDEKIQEREDYIRQEKEEA